MSNSTYTHPDVLTRGVQEGWAEEETDPTRIDWAARQAKAAIPFHVVDDRPVKPGKSTGIKHGRGELGHWGEKQNGDAIVFVHWGGSRWVLLIDRDDDKGWGFPGGGLDEDEPPLAGVVRELAEETGLVVPDAVWRMLAARVVPDPRGTDEAWMATWPAVADLGDVAELPAVAGASDARRAEWVRADTYAALVTHLADTYEGRVFAAHQAMLAELLAVPALTERCTAAALLEAAARLDALLALVPAGQWSLHEDLIVTGGTAQSAILTDARDGMDALVLSGDWHGEALAAIRLLTGGRPSKPERGKAQVRTSAGFWTVQPSVRRRWAPGPADTAQCSHSVRCADCRCPFPAYLVCPPDRAAQRDRTTRRGAQARGRPRRRRALGRGGLTCITTPAPAVPPTGPSAAARWPPWTWPSPRSSTAPARRCWSCPPTTGPARSPAPCWCGSTPWWRLRPTCSAASPAASWPTRRLSRSPAGPSR
ncbi:NUDIX domain-containing protein [Streptosporangium canum]|uniref:NUDIX domain-containing protein n=1 Tax=Streptosporangium canum TaxID=324952 RepID=UPI00341BD348